MIPIVHQHPDFIIINKPTGINMHQTAIEGNKDSSLVDVLCAQENLERLYLVHRLDTPTSGTMVLAKNKTTAQALNSQFSNHEVGKCYLALLSKKPKKKQGKIQGVMTKTRNGSYKLISNKKIAGHDEGSTSRAPIRAAVTLFMTQALPESALRLGNNEQDNRLESAPSRVAIVKPLTGKTHQIRVALKALGAPILGDTRYKGSFADRLYLHSMFLSFTLNNKQYEFKSLPNSGKFFHQALFNTLPNLADINWPSHTIPKL